MRVLLSITCILLTFNLFSQHQLAGKVTDGKGPLAFASVTLPEILQGAQTDEDGAFRFTDLPKGTYEIIISYVGFETFRDSVSIPQTEIDRSFTLKPLPQRLEQVVVSATRSNRELSKSAVMVGVIDSRTLENTSSCNLSEGLRFQPGLRVETDCQTCNYTQLRINGLGGGYSQILINGRPIISPLMGLYGLEQIPSSMVERIEVVRGGGSTLYGSSAIGGTVNVITRMPRYSSYDINADLRLINGQTPESVIDGRVGLVSESGKQGASFFLQRRQRDTYDHNNDGFSELPSISNYAFGSSLFFIPSERQKLEMSFHAIAEDRYGGQIDRIDTYLAEQAEERRQEVVMATLDYQHRSKNERRSIIGFASAQRTKRAHYTGILPDETSDLEAHLSAPPYGESLNTTLQFGSQLDQEFRWLPEGRHVVTTGIEYLTDNVYDEIEAYNYLIDQQTHDLGAFLQSDLEWRERFFLLAGLRYDLHNLVDRAIVSPRIAAMYHPSRNAQIRLSWAQGFRAPQAFDADMHIAFAGGGISRIALSEGLREERSDSFTASYSVDWPGEKYIAGVTISAFDTRLHDAFYLHALGRDSIGERFEKRNGQGAVVRGLSLEARANFNGRLQLQGGLTWQQSNFNSAVAYVEGLTASRQFLRTPDLYGFTTVDLNAKQWRFSLNYVYTGSMLLTHFAGAPEQAEDAYVTTPSFHETSILASRKLVFSQQLVLECSIGVRNLTNAYQSDFDSGKNRDSNYVYGPSMPRTFIFGVKLTQTQR